MWLLHGISLPHIARHGVRTVLALLGIAVGVSAILATAIVSESLFDSFRREIEATAGSADLQLVNGSIGVPEELLERVAAVSGVSIAAPLVEGFVSLANDEGDMLAVFGLDLLKDDLHRSQLPRSAIQIIDETEFLNQPDSIALSRSFAVERGYDLGDDFWVLTPYGRKKLVVRGLVASTGPASLFGGMVALMDIYPAQLLLGKVDRLDRIDVRLTEGASQEAVTDELRSLVRGSGFVQETVAGGTHVGKLLFSVRVALALASLVGAVVGLFVIYHTVTVSIGQRRRDIALLCALGVPARTILLWLFMEAAILGAIAAVFGAVFGVALARVSLDVVGAVTAAWVRLPIEGIVLSPSVLVIAVGTALTITFAATLLPVWSTLSQPTARLLHLLPEVRPAKRGTAGATAAAFACLLTAGALLLAAPRSLPYLPLVTFIFFVNCLALLSFALFSPLGAAWLGRLAHWLGARGRGLQLLLAGGAIERNPFAPVAVVAAIVMGLGWTLADAALVDSFKHSWLKWLDEHYQSDLVVTAGPASISLLTYPPVAGDLVDRISQIPGVRAAQGLRTIEILFDSRPTVVQGIDWSERGLPMLDDSWEDAAPRFWSGEGVVVSENLAHKSSLKPGDVISVATSGGEWQVPVLGIFSDFQGGGDLGSIAVSREEYQRRWEDTLVSKIRVWTHPGKVGDVRREIHRRYGQTHGVHAMTFAQAREAVTDLIENVFTLTYALVLIALFVSFVGVTNFLMSAILDRRVELRTLEAVGVSARTVARTLMSEGGLLGILAVTLGLAAGAVVSRIIVLHSVPMVNGWHFTYVFPFGTAVTTAAGSLLLAIAAGLLPARFMFRRRVRIEELQE
jgi:putative ABC transport system permease protein